MKGLKPVGPRIKRPWYEWAVLGSLAVALVVALIMVAGARRQARIERERAEAFKTEMQAQAVTIQAQAESLTTARLEASTAEEIIEEFKKVSNDNSARVLKAGETFTAERDTALLDPRSLAGSVAAKKHSEVKSSLMSQLQAESVELKEKNRRLEMDLMRVKGQRPWYFVGGFVVGAGVAVLVDKL